MTLILLFIFALLGGFLRFYHLSATMPFIGDQAWFYLSARDALLTGQFPLLGITSSVTWLHQGPLWTYFLIPCLAITRFHPLSGAIFSGLLSTLTIFLCYFLGRLWFNRKAGLAAAFIFAVSPLAVIHARMPYHTSVIPFFFALFLLLFHRRKYFWAALILGFLYQLELATVVLWPIVLLFLIFRRDSPKFSYLLAFIIGILPFLLSGPVQTGGVFIWTLYHLLFQPAAKMVTLPFYINLANRFFLPAISDFNLVIILASVGLAVFKKRLELLWLLLPLFVIVFNGTTSEAYFTLLIIPLSLFSGMLVASIFPRYVLFTVLAAWWLLNSFYLLSADYAIDPGSYGATFNSRSDLARQVFRLSLTSAPAITVAGSGNQFASTKDPYVYLLWWYGLSAHPSGNHLKFEINDQTQTFRVLQ